MGEMKKMLLVVLFVLVSCGGGQPTSTQRYVDSYVCYSTSGSVVDSDEGVYVAFSSSSDTSYRVYSQDGSLKKIPVNGCFVTYGD